MVSRLVVLVIFQCFSMIRNTRKHPLMRSSPIVAVITVKVRAFDSQIFINALMHINTIVNLMTGIKSSMMLKFNRKLCLLDRHHISPIMQFAFKHLILYYIPAYHAAVPHYHASQTAGGKLLETLFTAKLF